MSSNPPMRKSQGSLSSTVSVTKEFSRTFTVSSISFRAIYYFAISVIRESDFLYISFHSLIIPQKTMDTLTCQQTQTSNFSDQNNELDSDEESYTSIREIIGLFPGKKNSDAYDHQSQDVDGIDVQSSDDNEHQSQDMERIGVQRPDINEDQKEGMDRIDVQTSETSHREMDKETLEQEESFSMLDTTLGQQDTSAEESSLENMSIDTADKYQIKFVASGTTPEPFEYIPWKIQLNEGNGIHATLHQEVIAVLDGKATTKEIFSPFHNRSFQEFHSYLGENNFFFDSLDCIARLPKEKLFKNDKALHFMAFFVHDFVMDFRQNCVKHMLLHQGDKEKHSINTVRRWFGGEDNGQLEGLVQCLENDIKCNEEDEHTDFCLKQVSRYSFNYNKVRKRMYDLCTASKIAQFPIVTFGVGSVALSLVREGKEDLLSIFYFACHHYSVFGEEFIQLLKKRHFLIPQLLSERYGKLTVVQLLVYDGDHVHPKATRAVKFDEGIYVSHLFCPFLLHPMLEQKSYRSRIQPRSRKGMESS